MRISFYQILLLLWTSTLVSATSSSAQELLTRRVSLNIENEKIESAIRKIGRTASVSFVYSRQQIGGNRRVSVSAQDKPLSKVLDALLTPNHISYEVSGSQILLRANLGKNDNSGNKADEISVTGLVTDEKKQPLPGVTVAIRNTTSGTITDPDGKFSLSVADESVVLVFSYIGYQKQEITVGKRSTFNIQLIPDIKSLQEIVVIGYGEQSRSKVVGAVGTIKSEILQKVAAPSAELQLAGKMSGVIISQSNGQPGEGAKIVIRGIGTLTAGNTPLIVVDGFPLSEGTSLNAVNPNDIESMDVLKDAASAAIYGSRAANGVILITTKKGKGNNKFRVSLNAYWGVQKQTSGTKLVDAYEFAQFLSEARDWGYVSKDPANRSATDPNSVRVTKKIGGKNIDGRELQLDELKPYLNNTPGLMNTNWMDEAFRTVVMSNYDVSMYGGNEKTNFYTSVGYFSQDGVVIGTGLKRYSASFSVENKLNDHIKIGFNVKPSYTNQRIGVQENRSSGALALIPLSFPFYSPYKTDGSLNISDQLVKETRLVEGINVNGTPVENLVATSTLVKNNPKRFKTFGNIFVEAELLKGLTYKLTAGGDYDSYTEDFFYPSSVGEYRIPAPRPDANGHQIKTNTANYLIENIFNYRKELGDHNFNLLAGHTFQKQNYNYTKSVGTGFPDNNIQNIAGASSFLVTPVQYTWALESYLSRLQYDYKARYLLSAAIRTDGSSRFGANNRWGAFPSLSLGWVLSKESFFPKTNLIGFAKLSASMGKTGNNQIGNYGSLALVNSANYVSGSVLLPGYITTSAPNPDLGWETATSLNFGLDLGLLSNKLNLNLAYYKTNTRDLLLNVPVPQQTGYNTVLSNIGEMENKGFEFQLSGDQFNIGSVKIGFNTNFTTYSNKVLTLGPGQKQIATGLDQHFITKIGHPIAEIYGYNLLGIYKTQDEINKTPHLDGTLTGDYIVEDVNKDGKIDVNDKVAKGTYAPKITYGFGASAAYKGFTFSFNFMGVGGRTLLDGDMSSLTEAGEGFAIPTKYYFDHRYHPEHNPDGFLGQPNFGNFSNARKLTRSSAVTETNNGDYLRLRDVRLAYDFSGTFLQKARLSQLQIYASANNVLTFTKFRGWNPDGTPSGTNADILTSGFTNGSNYPVSSVYMLGLRVTY